MKLSCPACGAEVKFKSTTSVFGVCSFCNSTLVRHDLNLETLGKMAPMPQDLSPLQLGTTGVYKGGRFEIVGRQRIAWQSGAWNEWFLHFDKTFRIAGTETQDAWLSDAQGFYMLSFQVFDQKMMPKFEQIKVGASFEFNGVNFTVDDVREVTCIASQGELPTKSVQGRKSTSVDFLGDGEEFANADYSPEGNRLFIGSYLEFEQFKFSNLRQIDGW